MTDREKLVAWMLQGDVEDEVSENTTQHRGYIADLMVANGVVVRETGEWVAVEESKDSDGFPMQRKCSCCGKRQLWMNAVTYNFCPNCGADMRRRENG